MKIGIIIYSNTGNTLSVAQKVGEALKNAGHTVTLERVEPVNSDLKAGVPVLKTAPDVSLYDTLIFASPVHAFSLAVVMKLYLDQISDLSNKKVYCFVTQQLKKAWMGGNRAVKQITSACKTKGANIMSSGIVNWSAATREKQIEDLVGKFRTI